VSWREALKGGGTFCFLDERPAPHRDLGEAELAKVRRGAVFFAPKALRDPAPLVRLLLEGHLGALAFVPERLEPEPALGVHPGFYPLDLDFETLWRRTFSPEEGLARVIADYFNV